MKYAFVLFLALSFVLIACSSDDESIGDNTANSEIGDRVSDSNNLSCNQQFSYGGESDPARATLTSACVNLRQLQESAEITDLEILEQDDFSAEAKVTAKLLSCQWACISEVERTYELYLNPTKLWETKSDYSGFVETVDSRNKRFAQLGEDLAKGISFAVFSSTAEVGEFPFTLIAPIEIKADSPTEHQRWSWVELDVIFPDGQETTYWRVHGVYDYVGKGEQQVTFSEKQESGKAQISRGRQQGEVVQVVCIRIAYQLSGVADQIKTECLPPSTK